MPHQVFSSCWNPEEVGSNANDGMDFRVKQEQKGEN